LGFLNDPAVIAGLGYGVRRHSRVCAVGLLIYWVLSRLALLGNGGQPGLALCLLLVFSYLFWSGVMGTFALKRLQRRTAETTVIS
jgi:hypothetical protein